jgi:ATP-dependent RNA helicase RhlE
LASQTAQSFKAYGGRLPLSSAVIFGGVPLGPQQRRLDRGVDILVATPGRLLDLVDRDALALSSVEILVLDEADRMLDLGFVHALKRIVKLLPRVRQTLLFSATMPSSIANLAEQYLDDPVRVAVAPAATTAERVAQSVVFVPSERKRELLTAMLRDPSFARVLVFTRTKHGADRVTRHLGAAGIEAAAIHGNKSQPQRERALAGFRAGDTRILVATDIAARGIDVERVSHVVNFDLPNVPEDYVHRIGRTARAGAAGTAIAFCSDDERPYLRDIEKLTRQRIAVNSLSGLRSRRDGDGAEPPAKRATPASANPQQVSKAPPPGSGNPHRRETGSARSATAASLPAFLRRPAARSPAGADRRPERAAARAR